MLALVSCPLRRSFIIAFSPVFQRSDCSPGTVSSHGPSREARTSTPWQLLSRCLEVPEGKVPWGTCREKPGARGQEEARALGRTGTGLTAVSLLHEREEKAHPAVFVRVQLSASGPLFVCVHPSDSLVLSLGFFLFLLLVLLSLFSLSVSQHGSIRLVTSHNSLSVQGAFEKARKGHIQEEHTTGPTKPQCRINQQHRRPPRTPRPARCFLLPPQGPSPALLRAAVPVRVRTPCPQPRDQFLRPEMEPRLLHF